MVSDSTSSEPIGPLPTGPQPTENSATPSYWQDHRPHQQQPDIDEDDFTDTETDSSDLDDHGRGLNGGGRHALYKQASAPITSRVSDLLGRMTLEEKIAQLLELWVSACTCLVTNCRVD